MKRANSSENDPELDDSLDLHPRSHDNFENELLSKKLKSDEVNNTVGEEVPQCLIPGKEITELCDSVTSLSDNCNEISKSHCENDGTEDVSKSPKQESNNVEKPIEEKGQMLLEAISSDDDIAMDSEEDGALDSDGGGSGTEYSDDILKWFNPSQFEATPFRIIQDPSLSVFEYIHRKLGGDSKCEEVSELMNCLEYLETKNINSNEKWIITAERSVQILPKALSHILNIPEYCHKLFSLVNVTLDYKYALKHVSTAATLVIRHLKIGFQLTEALCHYNEDLSEHLIKHHQIHSKLIHLFFVEHMSLSLKLDILRALDSSLNGFEPIRLFLYTDVSNDLNGYQTLLKILSLNQRPRVCFSVTSILRKIHFYELLQKLNVDVNTLDSQSELLLQESLAEITTTFIKAPILMGCPKRFLQARAQFELTVALTKYDVYPTIYRLFDASSLINCITQLLNQPNCRISFEQNILKLLQSLIDCDHGLRYLGSRYKELNQLLKVLCRVSTQFKSTLIYKVKVLTLIDYLCYFWECNIMDNFKLDLLDSVDILQDMFLLTQSEIGKYAVVNVLTMGDNLEVILNSFKYMEQTKSTNNDLHMMYSLDLILIVLENSEDVGYLKKYGELIYDLVSKQNCYNELATWTFPAKKQSTFSYDDISELCNIVKNNVDNCLSINKTLITSLRILKYLAAPNDETVSEEVEDFIELKYKYIILQMFSNDMLENLLSIIDKICNSYKLPLINACNLIGHKAKNKISIIRPSMVLIRCMVIYLIKNRGNLYYDLSPIKILLKLYNLMHHVPADSIIQEDASKVIKDISKILEAYVEIKIGSSMAKEVIAWTLYYPSNIVPGLLLLCKLLPSPLPIKTKKPLDEPTIATMISFRNMWIDHLAKLSNEFVELISILSASKLLLEPLERLCSKISDLSMSLCLFVTQSLLKVLIDADNTYSFNGCLNLLTKLCNNKKLATIKTVVLQTLNEEKPQENVKKLVQKICDTITVGQQENSILFVQCLCDSDIIICGSNHDENLPRNSVPSKWFFNYILKSLLSLFESHNEMSTMSLAIQTCKVIIKNDYGFYQFKMGLDLFPKALYNIFYSLLQKWKKEDVEYVNILTDTVQLLNLCIKNDLNTRRVLFLSSSQLREYLQWSNDVKDHPIYLLKDILQQDNSTDLCWKHLTCLIDLLNNDQEPTVELIEPQLTAIDYLTPTFKDRLFYVIDINNEIDDSNKDFYTKAQGELVECNIEEIASDLTDFNIKDKINELFKIEDCEAQPEPNVYKLQEPIIKEREHTASTSTTTTTHTRHQVFSRLGTIQRPDSFRNRLPNTSRPPSLHVDDFVAMETRTARQQQPPRYKLPIQPIQDLNIRLRERQMAYERTYSLLNPYKSHLNLHSWHAQVNALAHLRADYHQTINSRHLELQRHSLVQEWRQLRVEAALRTNRVYSRR